MNNSKCNCDCCHHTTLPTPVHIGEKVSDMSFAVYHNDEEKKMSLGELKGKWAILFFYPKDFTFVCPTELEDMAKHYDAFKKEGAEVISVSTDTVPVHKAWHDTSDAIKKIKFPMAADPAHRLSHMFGVHIENDGVALRGSFVIDPDGVLQLVEINPDGVGRNAKELLRKLQAAKFVREHGDQVCPANWNPGDDTLRPGMNLVGKI